MKIAMLLSGGVDSSVALALLQQQGYQITAFYLKIWLEDELSYLGECPWEEDLSYARAVCEKLNIPLEVISLQKAYKDKILAYTIEEIKKGRTPNPDMLCNPMIKFGAFLEAVGNNYDKVATGHYAGLLEKEGIYYLHQVPDPIKDQTYFLARLSQKQLSEALFPLDKYYKQDVRELAQRFDLPTKDRKDSQGLCFLGKITFKDFIAHHVGFQKGPLVEYETGRILAEHDGFWFYTIGQRQGLGLSHGPWYVVAKDSSTNTVFISNQYYDQNKKRNSFFVEECMWNESNTLNTSKNVLVKIRHGKQLHDATVTFLKNECCSVVLKDSDQGIAAGQFAVFYKNNLVVGSGIIGEHDMVNYNE